MHLMAVKKKSRKLSGLVIYSHSKQAEAHLQQLKEMQCFKLGI